MASPTLIVVHGPPASGKTRLSQWLANRLQLALLSKDDFKDELFNHFEYQSAEQSDRIERASLGLLWLSLGRLMSVGTHNLIVETAFVNADSQPKLTQLAHDHGYQVVQIFCRADERVLRQRYIDRANTAQRHPGHQDLQKVENQPIPERSSFRAMDLAGPLIDIDTSDLKDVNYQQILQQLKELL